MNEPNAQNFNILNDKHKLLDNDRKRKNDNNNMNDNAQYKHMKSNYYSILDSDEFECDVESLSK